VFPLVLPLDVLFSLGDGRLRRTKRCERNNGNQKEYLFYSSQEGKEGFDQELLLHSSTYCNVNGYRLFGRHQLAPTRQESIFLLAWDQSKNACIGVMIEPEAEGGWAEAECRLCAHERSHMPCMESHSSG
jgi:hypothetical protein